MKIDKNLMHVLTTALNHADYMRYRAAHNKIGLKSSAFLRILVTLGLDACVNIANKGKQKADLRKQLETIQSQLAILEGKTIPVASFNTNVTKTGKFSKGFRDALVRKYLTLNPSATAQDIQSLLSAAKGKFIPLTSAKNALYRNR